ncbi:MAG: PQQ-dependent sugar dehydrogenase, partial [Pirellulaceae bacterium]
VGFSQATYQVIENGTPVGAAVTLTRNATGSSSVVQVNFPGTGTATAGLDYTSTPINVTFNSSDTSKTVVVPIINDQLLELAETLGISLKPISNATLGTQSSAKLVILSDDTSTVSIAANDPNANEIGDNGQFTLSLSGGKVASDHATTLTVRLSNNADGIVDADAIRIVRTSGPAGSITTTGIPNGSTPPGSGPSTPIGGPQEIEVLWNGSNIADGSGSINFGPAEQGDVVSRVFTVHNIGGQNLTLGSISLPTGFTLATNFGTATLAPGASTTFSVRMTTSTVGSFSGQISFATNDSDENPFNFAVSGTVGQQTGSTAVRLQPVVTSGLSNAVLVTNAGDGSGRLFVLELAGRIRIIENGVLQATPFLDISSRAVSGGEAGLLGLAFHPDFATRGAWGEGRFYVQYSAPATAGGDHDMVIAEYRVSSNPNVATFASERILLRFSHPFGNHNAGALAFGPTDHMLYIASGDGGSGNDPNNNAQNLNSLLGKILRIDPSGNTAPGGQYSIPADNPFFGQSGVRQEIYAYGLRNPFRLSFDLDAGRQRLFVGDVGQGAFEEVDLITAGGNYGWRANEGAHDNTGVPDANPQNAIDPIAEYVNPTTGVAVIGGFIYRGSKFPTLEGKYIFGDLTGRMMYLKPNGDNWSLGQLDVASGNPIGSQIWSFGVDDFGELYLVTPTSVYAVLGNPDVQIEDNGDARFSTTGAWTSAATGYQRDEVITAAGNGNRTASWSFDVMPGVYTIQATWTANANRATNATYEILDGTTVIARGTLNQQSAPNDITTAGATWETILTGVAVGQTLIHYSIGGSAMNGVDYGAISGVIAIQHGQASAVINISGIVNERVAEGDETVVVTLLDTNAPGIVTVSTIANTATVTIHERAPIIVVGADAGAG